MKNEFKVIQPGERCRYLALERHVHQRRACRREKRSPATATSGAAATNDLTARTTASATATFAATCRARVTTRRSGTITSVQESRLTV